MFKRKTNDSGRNSMFQFAFRIFFVHIINIIVFLILGMLIVNLDNIGVELSDISTSAIITAVCMVLYIVMVYLECWRRGERDYNLVLYKHMEYNKLRGLYAGLISQIPALVGAILIIIPSTSYTIVRLVRYFYMNFNVLFVYADELLESGELSRVVYHILHFVPAILAPVIGLLAYNLGYKRFRIIDHLVWKKSDGKKRENLR